MILLLLACAPDPATSPLADVWPAIPAEVVARATVDALFPSDVLVRPDGAIWVLDGYRGRIVPVVDGKPGTPFGAGEGWGRPVRLAASSDDGAWLVDPAGRLIEIDAAGHTERVLDVGATDALAPWVVPCGPVALVDDGTGLVVSDRHGQIVWLDRVTGGVRSRVVAEPGGPGLGTVTDLVRVEGAVLASDAVAGRVHHVGDDGSWRSFGRYGLWVGTLKQPKAVLAVDGGVFVADTALRAVQLFTDDGSARGVITVDGEIPDLGHPVALDQTAEGDLVVLDAANATVWTLRFEDGEIARTIAAPPPRWKRRSLTDTYAGPAGAGGRDCLQCHDGLVNDSRQVWDPTLGHHPIHEPLESKPPSFFTLDDHDQMTCTTCHSPHGASTLGDVEAVQAGADPTLLVRHVATEPFLRMSRDDSSLCVACHGATPHDDVVDRLGIGGGAHPVGAELAASMEGRSTGADDDVGCLGCHAVHGASGEHLVRGEADGRLCATCHETEALPGSSHPVGPGAPPHPSPPPGAALPLDGEGHATCRTCHDLVGGAGHALLRLPEDGTGLCGSCHDDVLHAVADGHGGVAGVGGSGCLGCHEPHDAAVPESLLRDLGTRSAADPLACLGCHAPGRRAAVPGRSPGRKGHPVDGLVHAEVDGPLSCVTCHDPHGPHAEEASCADCHAEQVAAGARGGHGGATCLDCHPAHDDPPAAALAALDPGSRACLGCHLRGEEGATPITSWRHPDLVFRPDGARWDVLAGLPLYAESGERVPDGQNGDLTCSSCHLTHGPDALEPGDHLRRPGWKEVCTSCHGPDALPLYRWFHQPDRRRDVVGAAP